LHSCINHSNMQRSVFATIMSDVKDMLGVDENDKRSFGISSSSLPPLLPKPLRIPSLDDGSKKPKSKGSVFSTLRQLLSYSDFALHCECWMLSYQFYADFIPPCSVSLNESVVFSPSHSPISAHSITHFHRAICSGRWRKSSRGGCSKTRL
jgi:hypothetical protein